MSRLAILHPTHLVAQELRERLGADKGLWQDLLLLTTIEEEVGTLTEVRGAATLVQGYQPDALAGVDLAFLCGPMEANRRVLEQLPAATRAVVLSPDAEIGDGVAVVEGVNLDATLSGQVLLSPNPAAIHLAHLLHPLRGLGLRRAVATLIQPASGLGGSALDDLLEQARDLLSFQPVTTSEEFPQQVAFNLLSTELPAESLSRQVEAVLGPGVAVAAQLLQAGVFHGSSASLFFELDPDSGLEAVREALEAYELLELRGPEDDPLGLVDAVNSEQVLVGHLRSVEQPSGGFWIWSVMDNITRGGALNALAIARAALG